MNAVDARTVREVFQRRARDYDAHVERAPHNVHCERPTMRRLMGDVRGLRTLDLGCGSGFGLRELLDAGATEVVGIDNVPALLELARRRTDGRARLIEASLEDVPYDLEDASFDLVVSSLAMHYLPDWRALLREARRLVNQDGRFLFSIENAEPSFGEVERVVAHWPSIGIDLPVYRRSRSSVSQALRAAGFELEQVVETRPIDELRETRPELYEKLQQDPPFVVFVCRPE